MRTQTREDSFTGKESGTVFVVLAMIEHINAAMVIKKQAIADALGLSVCIKSSSTATSVSADAVPRG